VRAQVQQLAEAGLQQLLLLPSFDMQYRVLEEFSRHVMAKF
jgi:hypothetical protein